VPWTTLLYRSRKKPQEALRRRLREFASTPCALRLSSADSAAATGGMEHQCQARLYRLDDEENLKVRSVERKKIARRQRVPQAQACGPNQCGSGWQGFNRLAACA